MTLALPKKRGRPTNEEIARRKLASAPQPARPDSVILTDLCESFEILTYLTKGCIAGNIRSVAVTGSAGVGKTYNIERLLKEGGNPYEIVRGSISAVNIFKLGYRLRRRGCVIVLDDADIFDDDEALNIVKALGDTSPERKISWMKESLALNDKESGEDVPRQYDFNGAIMIVSNLEWQKYIDAGGKHAEHFKAISDRSLYLNLRLFNRDEVFVWVNHITKTQKIFQREGVPDKYHTPLLAWMSANREKLRELSIRTPLKLAQFTKDRPDKWEMMARKLLLR